MRTYACALFALFATAALFATGCKPGGNGRDDSSTISLDGGGGTDSAPPGTDAGGTDGGTVWPDAGDYDAWTPPPDPGDSGMPLLDAGPADFGPAVVVDTMAVAPANDPVTMMPVGFDLDGDGTIDNQLANVPFGIDMINMALQDQIDMGMVLMLLEFRGVEDPTLTVDDPMMAAALYNGVDSDVPPDTTDNFSGTESFLVDPISLDAMGYPAVLFFNTSITGTPGAPYFYGERNSLPFAFPGFGALTIVNPRLSGDPTAGFAEFNNGLLGGVIQACALDQVPNPLGGGGTMLELLIAFGVTPDIDLSGDGLETFDLSLGFPSEIVSCTDGDGTVLPNLDPPRCACDERIEDGISMALTLHAVSAAITGVAP